MNSDIVSPCVARSGAHAAAAASQTLSLGVDDGNCARLAATKNSRHQMGRCSFGATCRPRSAVGLRAGPGLMSIPAWPIIAIAAVVQTGAATPAPTPSKDWPTRPVRIIIPLGPGGGGDVFTRLLAEELQKRWARPSWWRTAPAAGSTSAPAPAPRPRPTATRSACSRASRWSTTSSVQEPAVQSREGFRAGHQPVHQPDRARRQRLAQGQDHPGAGGAGEGEARHAELRHVLVHAGLFHGQAEQGERHRHRARAVPQRQRDGQRGHVRRDADRVSRPRQHARRRSGADRSPALRSTPMRARRCFPTFRRCRRRPARTIRRRGSACSRRPARRSRSSTSCTPRSCGSPASRPGGRRISSIAPSNTR